MEYIKLQNVIREKNCFTFEFDTSLKCFTKKSFFVDYGDTAINAPESIINIVFAAVMVPVCWATGAELSLPVLDEAYLKSLKDCKPFFEKWKRGQWAFNEKINTLPEKNACDSDKCGMLFSGGLDSLTTYIKHKEKKPELFTVFGADIPLSKKQFIEFYKKHLFEFADFQHTPIHWIMTDIREVCSNKKMAKYAYDWYTQVSHGMLLTSLTAPIGHKTIREFIIASSHYGPFDYMCGSDIELDSHIRWANTKVCYDNAEYMRHEKIIHFLKGHEEFYKHLRVCWSQFDRLNCGKCEKCLRTMVELLANNIDPQACNFPIDENTLNKLRKKFEAWHSRYRFFSPESRVYWREIKASVNLSQVEDRYGALAFFKWLKNFSIIEKRPNPIILSFIRSAVKMKRALFPRKKSC